MENEISYGDFFRQAPAMEETYILKLKSMQIQDLS